MVIESEGPDSEGVIDDVLEFFHVDGGWTRRTVMMNEILTGKTDGSTC